jgi:hypothetical protein
MARQPRMDIYKRLVWPGTNSGFAVVAPDTPGSWVVVLLDDGRMLKAPAEPSAAGKSK